MNVRLTCSLAAVFTSLFMCQAPQAAPRADVVLLTSANAMAAFRQANPDMSFRSLRGQEGGSSQTFLVVRAPAGSTLEVFEAGCGNDGKVARGALLEQFSLDGRTAVVMRGEISEGCPTRSICVSGEGAPKDCWEPFVSGLTGELDLRGPFGAWPGSPAGVDLLVTDSDKNGTNVRATPGGEIIDVIAWAWEDASDEARLARKVHAVGQEGKWLRVFYGNGRAGWMHRTVLGSCAAETENDEVRLHAEPGDGAGLMTVPAGTKLRVTAVRGGWARVQFKLNGRSHEGWLQGKHLFSNPYNSCWK